MHQLIREHFSPAFGIEGTGDSAVVSVPSMRLAYTTDSYVVTPLFFPGGNIGDLAVCGTVNDLAVAGAEPLFLTAGFIIEEGFPLADLKKIIASMAAAAKQAQVRIVAGDTKVVNKGKADGIFINTSGLGVLHEGTDIAASRIKAGDKVIISGEIGNHGVAIIAERNGLTFDPPVQTDSRPLNDLVRKMLDSCEGHPFYARPDAGRPCYDAERSCFGIMPCASRSGRMLCRYRRRSRAPADFLGSTRSMSRMKGFSLLFWIVRTPIPWSLP